MNLIAILPPGQTAVSVNGLHQWDYGRKLEIHASDLPTLVEVHFACPGMEEAVVRVCNVTRGVAVATIPDTCLEQTAPITAWVYVIDETSGATKKKITLTIEARLRPSATADIPVEISDKYTEAVTAMNAAVGKITSGEVTAAKANYTPQAAYASSAGSADSASHADTATSANSITTKLVRTISIDDNGRAALTDVEFKFEADTIYLCRFVQNTSRLTGSGVVLLCPDPNGYFFGGCGMGFFYLEISTSTNNKQNFQVRKSGDGTPATIGGTLRIYKLGGISA